MFNLTIRGEILHTTIDTLGALVDECKIQFNENGIAVSAVDPANVGMVDFSLSENAFESYSANGHIIGVDLEELADAVELASDEDLVHIKFDEDSNRIFVKYDGLRYYVRIITPKHVEEGEAIPDLNLPAKVTVEQSLINRGVKATSKIGDHIEIAVNAEEGEISLRSKEDINEAIFDIEKDSIDMDANSIKAEFSSEYIEKIESAVPEGTEVVLMLGENFPVKLQYEISNSNGEVTYMLAPRVDNS